MARRSTRRVSLQRGGAVATGIISGVPECFNVLSAAVRKLNVHCSARTGAAFVAADEPRRARISLPLG